MRYWTFVQPTDDSGESEYVTMSEDEIRKEYWPYWYGKMCEKFGKDTVDKDYSFEDCLVDWEIVHWAWPSTLGLA